MKATIAITDACFERLKKKGAEVLADPLTGNEVTVKYLPEEPTRGFLGEGCYLSVETPDK